MDPDRGERYPATVTEVHGQDLIYTPSEVGPSYPVYEFTLLLSVSDRSHFRIADVAKLRWITSLRVPTWLLAASLR